MCAILALTSLAHCFDPETAAVAELSLAAARTENASTACLANYQARVTETPGLIGYWSFEETAGTTGADSVGGFTLNYVSGATPGVPGFAGDGSSRALEISRIANDISAATVVTTQTTSISLEVWVYWDGDTAAPDTVFYNGDTSWSGFGLFMINTGQLAILSGNVALAPVDFTLTPATWTHVVMVRDPVFWNFYVNGSARTIQGSLEALPIPAGGVLQVGGNRPAFTELFGGRLDEAAIYTSALNAAQVQTHYAAACL